MPSTDPSLVCPCRQLNLGYNNIGLKGAEALAPALVTSRLMSLDMRYNSLGGKGQTMIRKAVEGREGFNLKMY